MPRQPLSSVLPAPRTDLIIGNAAAGKRPQVEAAIMQCIMTWQHLEAHISTCLALLLKTDNAAALAVFHSLRRSDAQYKTLIEAALVTLGTRDNTLLEAFIDVTKSTEKHRNALVHGHYGHTDDIRDGILWMSTNDYVHYVVEGRINAREMTDQLKHEISSKVYVYRLNDITAIYDEIVSLSRMWFYFIDYLKVNSLNEGNRNLIDKEYRRLCDQPRIAKALAILRQRSTRQAQP